MTDTTDASYDGRQPDGALLQRLGDSVRAERARRRLKIQELADLVGVHRNTISRIEGGKLDPTYTVLRRLADALGVSIDKLAE